MTEDGNNERAILTEIDHLHAQDEQLRRDMVAGFGSINTRLDSLATSLQQHGKTNWNATAVMVTVISVLGALVWFPINHRLTTGERALEEHKTIPGHTQALIMHARHDERFLKHQVHLDKIDEQQSESQKEISERFDRLDDTLQREMRILDDRMIQQIESMDRRLQMEMRLLQAAQTKEVQNNKEAIEKVDSWGSRRWMNRGAENQAALGPMK